MSAVTQWLRPTESSPYVRVYTSDERETVQGYVEGVIDLLETLDLCDRGESVLKRLNESLNLKRSYPPFSPAPFDPTAALSKVVGAQRIVKSHNPEILSILVELEGALRAVVGEPPTTPAIGERVSILQNNTTFSAILKEVETDSLDPRCVEEFAVVELTDGETVTVPIGLIFAV